MIEFVHYTGPLVVAKQPGYFSYVEQLVKPHYGRIQVKITLEIDRSNGSERTTYSLGTKKFLQTYVDGESYYEVNFDTNRAKIQPASEAKGLPLLGFFVSPARYKFLQSYRAEARFPGEPCSIGTDSCETVGIAANLYGVTMNAQFDKRANSLKVVSNGKIHYEWKAVGESKGWPGSIEFQETLFKDPLSRDSGIAGGHATLKFQEIRQSSGTLSKDSLIPAGMMTTVQKDGIGYGIDPRTEPDSWGHFARQREAWARHERQDTLPWAQISIAIIVLISIALVAKLWRRT